MSKQLGAVNISTKFIRRWKSDKTFQPRGGIRSVEDVYAEKKEKELFEASDDPMKYNILGNKRKPKVDHFFYSDRKAGRGYTDFSTEVYPNRPYIWQPIRKYYKLNWFIMFGVLLLLVFCPSQYVCLFFCL